MLSHGRERITACQPSHQAVFPFVSTHLCIHDFELTMLNSTHFITYNFGVGPLVIYLRAETKPACDSNYCFNRDPMLRQKKINITSTPIRESLGR